MALELSTQEPKTGTKSCDEYAFAATCNSAGVATSDGLMSGNVNSGAMQSFSLEFAELFRLLGGDRYWVHIYGFDGCNTSGETVDCSMNPAMSRKK
ncbi:hypothetical protein ACFW42_09955 [Streptomyces albidoflavus]